MRINSHKINIFIACNEINNEDKYSQMQSNADNNEINCTKTKKIPGTHQKKNDHSRNSATLSNTFGRPVLIFDSGFFARKTPKTQKKNNRKKKQQKKTKASKNM